MRKSLSKGWADVSDKSVIRQYLEAVRDLSNAEAADLIGRTGEAVRLYRNGKTTSLNAETRRKMIGVIEAARKGEPADVTNERAEAFRLAAERVEEVAADLRDLASRAPSTDEQPRETEEEKAARLRRLDEVAHGGAQPGGRDGPKKRAGGGGGGE